MGILKFIEKILAQRPKAVGFWWSESEPWLPHPRNFIDKSWSDEERSIVVRYLRAAHHKRIVFMGYSECRLCDKTDNGVADIHDGVYVWPEGLAHYVIVHRVRLPEEFVAHVRARSVS